VNPALERQLARLRTRLAKTPLPGYFRWWIGQLVACLPPRWRALVEERSESLLVDVRPEEIIVWRERADRASEYARISRALPAEAQGAEFQRLRGAIDDPGVRTVFCIPAERVLQRNLVLPAAAEDNLRQVLSFEMDRQTPFKADQVYFDYRLGEREAAARNLQVELIVVPRAPLDADLAKLAAGSLELDGVDCWREGPGSGRLGLNLLPADRRPRRVNARLRLNLGLAAAAIVLLFTAMLLSLGNREAALAAMSEQVEKAQNAAKQVGALRKTLQDSISAANFLNRRKHEMPTMVQMLADLTDRLPDDTYLERIAVDEKAKIDVQGLSDNTAKLTERLRESTVLENPSFQGNIQQDPRTHKDRFNMTLEFRHKAEPDTGKEHGPAKDKDPGQRKDGKDGGTGNAPAAGSP